MSQLGTGCFAGTSCLLVLFCRYLNRLTVVFLTVSYDRCLSAGRAGAAPDFIAALLCGALPGSLCVTLYHKQGRKASACCHELEECQDKA